MSISKWRTKIFSSPIICVISAPSGSGKTTVLKRLMKKLPEVAYSVSFTTRKPRPGEVYGSDYYFISPPEFKERIKENYFIEWAKVHDNYYGTPRKFLESYIKKGKDVILDLDVRGGLAIKKKYPDSICIFLLPPSMEELVRRLKKRKKDSPNIMRKRLANAKGELKKINHYDYTIINEKLYVTIERIKNILEIEKMKVKRNKLEIQRFISYLIGDLSKPLSPSR